ncbi:hypothetical protein [Pseudomonas tohonis]|uniref:hypothetical protein n=1 Tax=Pseudomonas tohonis TaxID=2725477 RepID=UPI001F20DB94|nr:hypothetical protein [Pseudomonas tohonis]
MTERELLEMAAKAAGILGEWHERGQCIHVTGVTGMSDIWWRPLEDDGDALRLAIGLDIHVKRFAGSTTAMEHLGNAIDTQHDHWKENANDPMISTRRAIVRAAAEIGRAMG